jgi:hypothetical protein
MQKYDSVEVNPSPRAKYLASLWHHQPFPPTARDVFAISFSQIQPFVFDKTMDLVNV